jgi:hypothetical protein
MYEICLVYDLICDRDAANFKILFVQGHPHVITFRKAFVTDEYLAVVMDYARGGDLHRYMAAKNVLRIYALKAVQ